jgi:hypothetical protein
MTTERLDTLDNIFDRITDKRSSRDAAARNCAREVIGKNLGTALQYAEAMVQHETALEALYEEMNALHPKAQD